MTALEASDDGAIIETGRQKTVIMTRSGQPIDYLDPEKTTIKWDDITYALPRIYRYGGHQNTTLLDHLALCTMIARVSYESFCGPEIVAYAAAHDIHEVYVGDISTGLKEVCPEFRDVEDMWHAHVHEFFGLAGPMPKGWSAYIKEIDIRALHIECLYNNFNTLHFVESGVSSLSTLESAMAGLVFTSSEQVKTEILLKALYRDLR